MQNSVARFGTILWNSLGTSTRKLSQKQFKEKLLAPEDNNMLIQHFFKECTVCNNVFLFNNFL